MQVPQIVSLKYNKTSQATWLVNEHVSDVSITSGVSLISALALWPSGWLMDAGL